MMVWLVLCLVHFSCVIALPDPTWKATFERPGDENGHGDYGSNNFHPINPTAAFKPNGFGNEYNPQSYDFHPPAPSKDNAMMAGPSLYTNPNGFKPNVNHGASDGYFYTNSFKPNVNHGASHGYFYTNSFKPNVNHGASHGYFYTNSFKPNVNHGASHGHFYTNSFKPNVNHGASHGYFYNHHTPQYNQHPFHNKEPTVLENDFNESRNGFKPVMMNQQEEGSLENVDDNEGLKRGHSQGYHHSYYNGHHHGHHHGYYHGQQIYYKPVVTEEGDIKFVPVFFRPQIGHYPPFDYFLKPKPHHKDEEDSTESNEKHDGFLENNQEQQKESTLELNESNDKQDDSIIEDELEGGEQEE